MAQKNRRHGKEHAICRIKAICLEATQSARANQSAKSPLVASMETPPPAYNAHPAQMLTTIMKMAEDDADKLATANTKDQQVLKELMNKIDEDDAKRWKEIRGEKQVRFQSYAQLKAQHGEQRERQVSQVRTQQLQLVQTLSGKKFSMPPNTEQKRRTQDLKQNQQDPNTHGSVL